MKVSITQETITGQVEEVDTKNDYLVKFVIKTIREGQTTWLNATATTWQAWRLREGDQVSLTGEVTLKVWENPFLSEQVEAMEIAASEISFAA